MHILAAAIQASTFGHYAVSAAGIFTLLAASCVKALRRRPAEFRKRGVIVSDGRPRFVFASGLSSASDGRVTIAGISISKCDETKHFKIIGSTGTGKSTAIREILKAALSRGDRAVVADPDGGYCSSFFHRYRGDILLNPLEAGSVKWDPFAEVNDSHDVDQLASALIPSSGDPSASEWRGYARTFLCAVLRRSREAGSRSTSELWRLLSSAAPEELRDLVAGTPAQPFMEGENARMFASIRSVAVSAMAAFDHVQRQRASPFSVREWVRNGSTNGVLFMPYKAGQIAALKSVIATWMRLAIFEALSGKENHDQRIWMVIDELDALGPIDGLKDALARLRKFGGRCVLGFQSISQVSSTYGAGDAQTLVENCANTLILRCSSSEHGGTSQFASRLIGEREVVRRQVTRGLDRDGAWLSRGARRSMNISEQHVIEAAVMPSELEQLPDLTGYLKTASSAAWRKVAFRRHPQRRTET